MDARDRGSLRGSLVEIFGGILVVLGIWNFNFSSSSNISAQPPSDTPYGYQEVDPNSVSPDPNNPNRYVSRVFRPFGYDANSGDRFLSER